MIKRLLLSSFLVAAVGCGKKAAITIEVDADIAALGGNQIVALQVVLIQGNESGAALFENDGAAITFPVTLSTRVDLDRLGEIRVGVAGLNDDNLTIAGGFLTLNLDGKEQQQIKVLLDNQNPCIAGDGTDINCCSNFLDDDNNGLTDCDEVACQDQFADLCENSTCGDGVVNPFAGEECDDETGDCNLSCVSEDLREFGSLIQLSQLSDAFDLNFNVSGLLNNSYRVQTGFVFKRTIGDCTRVDLQLPAFIDAGAEFFFADYGANRVLDAQGAELLSLQFPLVEQVIFKPFTPFFPEGQNISVELQGGANTDLIAAKQLFSGAAPTKLTLNGAQIEDTLVRGADYTLTWTATPGNTEEVVLVISSGNIQTQIFCQAPDAQEEIVVDGELTQGFNRGLANFQELTGFVADIGHGSFAEVTVDPVETSNQADAVNGTIFFTILNGVSIFGTVE